MQHINRRFRSFGCRFRRCCHLLLFCQKLCLALSGLLFQSLPALRRRKAFGVNTFPCAQPVRKTLFGPLSSLSPSFSIIPHPSEMSILKVCLICADFGIFRKSAKGGNRLSPNCSSGVSGGRNNAPCISLPSAFGVPEKDVQRYTAVQCVSLPFSPWVPMYINSTGVMPNCKRSVKALSSRGRRTPTAAIRSLGRTEKKQQKTRIAAHHKGARNDR